MKKILVINYSQSGQLNEILNNLTSTLTDAVNIDRLNITLKKSFPFPWKSKTFFDAMPESVLEIPTELEPLSFSETQYDLILVGYQPWFLSPSIPTTSFLKDPEFIKRLNGTPVITVIGARNMWINSQKSVVQSIQQNGGKLVANIPFVDKASNLASVVSILHWMLTGKKTKKWGIFPKPGVSDEDIVGSEKYGKLINEALNKNNFTGLQKNMIETGQIKILTTILFIEGRAKKLFKIWANLIKKKEKKSTQSRQRWLVIFKYYLIFALFIVSPIVLLIYSLLVRPFTQGKIKQMKQDVLYMGITKTTT